MDLFEQWKKIEEEKFIHKPISKEEIMEAIYQKSTGTMETLKTRLKYKMIWVLFFTLIFSGLLIWQFGNPILTTIFGVATVLYIAGFFGLNYFYRKMGIENKEGSTLSVMKSNYKLIKGALKFESDMMVPLFPFMLVGGMLVPRIMDGDSLVEIFAEPKFLIVMLIGIVILAPLMKLLSDRMNKFAYGSFIDKLKQNINEMEMIHLK